MCGIVGIRRFDGGDVEAQTLKRMNDLLRHRGPDDEGYLVRGGLGFGHRRLSIIDIGTSAQPMTSRDGYLHVCFNGEILNYKELRCRFAYPYQTQGDTEVLLSAFNSLGPASVHELVGQYAYAMYSEHTDVMWLFRDKMGILPLYYYWDGSVFVFGSEIKAVLAGIPGEPAVDGASLDAYLARRSVPAPWTLFEGVRKLPPGMYLSVSGNGVVSDPVRHWSLPSSDRAHSRKGTPTAEAIAECRGLLREAVAHNLVADVPVGAYLSGGLDSSLIVAMARQLAPTGNLQTFSASFGNPQFDETRFARAVAGVFNTCHREVAVEPGDFIERWPMLTWHRDAPISEASDVAVYMLAVAARSNDIKVVLSGEGSDELFAGYPKHQFARMTQRIGVVPRRIRGPLGSLLERRMRPRYWRARTAVRALSEPTLDRRLEGWFAPFTFAERRRLLRETIYRDRFISRAPDDPLHNMLGEDLVGWLPDNLLERGDRMSMAASVELRPPFLDSALVEWAWALPSDLKVRHRSGKWILREVARSLLPGAIVDRPKDGFRVPLDDWFRAELKETVRESLLADDSFVAGTLDGGAVRELIERHASGTANEGLRLWTLLSLEIWHRVFFGRDIPTVGRSGYVTAR
jgi:asparagine synthase (glutamine-hydrolysing)